MLVGHNHDSRPRLTDDCSEIITSTSHLAASFDVAVDEENVASRSLRAAADDARELIAEPRQVLGDKCFTLLSRQVEDAQPWVSNAGS